MDTGFKRLWSRRRSRDKRSNSALDSRDSYPPNIAFSRSTSAAAQRQDAPSAPSYGYGTNDRFNSLTSRQEPQLLAGSFLRPGTATSRPPTSSSIQYAVDRAANTFDESLPIQQPVSTTRRTSYSSVKPPKSIDIFAVTQTQTQTHIQHAPPRPSFNEDIAERNRDGYRQTFLHISPSNSPVIPGDAFSEDVAERNAPVQRFTPLRNQARMPSTNYQEDVASRNAPPPLVARRSMDVPAGGRERISANAVSSQSLNNPPRGLPMQTKIPPIERQISEASTIKITTGSHASAYAPQSQSVGSFRSPQIRPSDPTTVPIATTPRSDQPTSYNRTISSPIPPVPSTIPERSSLRSVSRTDQGRINSYQSTPAASLRDYGDFNLNLQSSPISGGPQTYSHVPGRYQLSPSEMNHAQGKSPPDRQRVLTVSPADRHLRPDFGAMRANSGTSNASSYRKQLNLPARTIIDFTAREAESVTEGSEYGYDGTPVIEWAETDVLQLVHPAMVTTPVSPTMPPTGLRIIPSPISEEAPILGNASDVRFVGNPAASASSLIASLQKPVPPLPSAPTIGFSPISVLASLPPGAIRPPGQDSVVQKPVLSSFIMNAPVTISPQRATKMNPRDTTASLNTTDGVQGAAPLPKTAQPVIPDKRVDLTLPPASVHVKTNDRADPTKQPVQDQSPAIRVDFTDDPKPVIVATPGTMSPVEDEAPVIPVQESPSNQTRHIVDQIATSATVPAVKPVTPTPPEGAVLATIAATIPIKEATVDAKKDESVSKSSGVHTRDFADFNSKPAATSGSSLTPMIRLPERHPSRPRMNERSNSGDTVPKARRMERGRSEDSVKKTQRRLKPDSRNVPRIAVYQSTFDEKEYARKQEQAKAALLRLQQSLDENHYQGTRPRSLVPSPTRTTSVPIAPRPNGVGVAVPPSSTRAKPQRVESSPSVVSQPVAVQPQQQRSQSPQAVSFHEIVTQRQPPTPTSVRPEPRGPTLPSSPDPRKGKERAVSGESSIPVPLMTEHFLDMALLPPRLLGDPNTHAPPSPGEVSLSSFPIPVSSPRTSKGSGEMKPGLGRTQSLKSITPSIMSSASIFSIPAHMIPDRSSSMRDQMVKEEEEG